MKIKTVLVVPQNDAEAVMITELARRLGIQLILSQQPHGATLDKEPDIVPLIREGGWDRVAIVEMPGVKNENKIKKMKKELVLIDHHHYTDLDRAHDPKTGKLLPSSLEQFLKIFKVTDAKIKKVGFDPRIVKGIGVLDRGFVWALMNEGYTKADIRKVLDLREEMLSQIHDATLEKKYKERAKLAWKNRKKWKEFFIIEDNTNTPIRERVSYLIALEIGKRTPVIIVERKRGFVYLQESPYALELFEKFGGFTFGMDGNWGYLNQKGKPKISLREVKKYIEGEEKKKNGQ